MILKHTEWENQLNLSSHKTAILCVENKQKLYTYTTGLMLACSGEENNWSLITHNFKQLSFEKTCVIVTDLIELNLNSKKLINALYKKCADSASTPEYEYEFKDNICGLFSLCKEISEDIGYDTKLNDDCELVDVFKLFKLEVKENYSTLVEKLIAFVNVNIELLKSKVFIFLFLSKFLNEIQLKQFLQHCLLQEVSVCLLEESLPNIVDKHDFNILKIDDDLCEFTN